MAPRPPPQPTEREASDHTRLLESVIEALQQQNAALVQQNTVALQNLEAARANSEATRRQLMEIIEITRNIAGASTSSGRNRTEWSWESFLQHHPAEFNEKCLPGEVEKVNVLEKNVTEVEQHMKQQQQVVRGTTSSRNNTNSRRTRRTPYARTGLPSISSGSQAQPLVAANRNRRTIPGVVSFVLNRSPQRSDTDDEVLLEEMLEEENLEEANPVDVEVKAEQ
ncbi:hypothetical protein LR48_Vigan09g108100 [Vigna angularis]|uniref:Uncharacterized protein n=1 Tax=Phaseolus angularis TaxID=3914 RepID=A0A0L9VBW5_PHAAN|nr:hypothetical protein LR48_Vigan09g108100 [Vigna angularis]